MPIFEGANGLNIHGGDFHDIVGEHHVYTLPTFPSSTGYAIPRLRNNSTRVQGVNHDKYRGQLQYVHSGYNIRTLSAVNSSDYALPRPSGGWMGSLPPHPTAVAMSQSQSTATEQVLEENAAHDSFVIAPPQAVPAIGRIEDNPDFQVDQVDSDSSVAFKGTNDDHAELQRPVRVSTQHHWKPLLSSQSDVVTVTTPRSKSNNPSPKIVESQVVLETLSEPSTSTGVPTDQSLEQGERSD